MNPTDEYTQVDAATGHLRSRDADSAGVGGGYGQPSDQQRTALRTDRSFAAHFEDRYQTDEDMFDSKTPHPICQRTRSKLAKKQRGYDVVRESDDDEDLGDPESEDEPDSDAGGATIGAQRGAVASLCVDASRSQQKTSASRVDSPHVGRSIFLYVSVLFYRTVSQKYRNIKSHAQDHKVTQLVGNIEGSLSR